MNQRNRKRTVMELFHNRFYNTRFIWWSAEYRAWENMAPVGREFGSPDYDRLMKEDADQCQSKLADLVAIYSAGKGAVRALEFKETRSMSKWRSRAVTLWPDTTARV
jgi:hypothetical protein